MDFSIKQTFKDTISEDIIMPIEEVFNVTDSGIYILYHVVGKDGIRKGMRVRRHSEFMDKIRKEEYLPIN